MAISRIPFTEQNGFNELGAKWNTPGSMWIKGNFTLLSAWISHPPHALSNVCLHNPNLWLVQWCALHFKPLRMQSVQVLFPECFLNQCKTRSKILSHPLIFVPPCIVWTMVVLHCGFIDEMCFDFAVKIIRTVWRTFTKQALIGGAGTVQPYNTCKITTGKKTLWRSELGMPITGSVDMIPGYRYCNQTGHKPCRQWRSGGTGQCIRDGRSPCRQDTAILQSNLTSCCKFANFFFWKVGHSITGQRRLGVTQNRALLIYMPGGALIHYKHIGNITSSISYIGHAPDVWKYYSKDRNLFGLSKFYRSRWEFFSLRIAHSRGHAEL